MTHREVVSSQEAHFWRELRQATVLGLRSHQRRADAANRAKAFNPAAERRQNAENRAPQAADGD